MLGVRPHQVYRRLVELLAGTLRRGEGVVENENQKYYTKGLYVPDNVDANTTEHSPRTHRREVAQHAPATLHKQLQHRLHHRGVVVVHVQQPHTVTQHSHQPGEETLGGGHEAALNCTCVSIRHAWVTRSVRADPTKLYTGDALIKYSRNTKQMGKEAKQQNYTHQKGHKLLHM